MNPQEIIKLLQAKKRNRSDCGCMTGEGCGCEVNDYNAAIDDCISALSKIESKEAEYREALEKIKDVVAQPPDRIKLPITLEQYSEIRDRIIDIVQNAMKETK